VSDVCYVSDPAEPEHGVYYLEDYVRSCYDRCGLMIQTLRYGTWTCRPDGHPNSPQDMIIAKKPPTGSEPSVSTVSPPSLAAVDTLEPEPAKGGAE
jgi:hypothetical protein